MIISPAEEQPIEAHLEKQFSSEGELSLSADLSEERGLFPGMTEGIDLPADLRTSTVTELLAKELSTECVLIDDGIVVCRRFVVHAPATGDEFQSTLVDELSHFRAHRIGLLVPPTPEEGHFNVDETSIAVLLQRVHHRVENVLHTGVLNVISS